MKYDLNRIAIYPIASEDHRTIYTPEGKEKVQILNDGKWFTWWTNE